MTNDVELERYRTLLDTPTEFKSGFGWITVAGILFCGLIMLPGGIYLSLMTGNNIGSAAQWVTVILFMEIARRSLKPLSRQNLVVLLHAAYVMMAASFLFPGGPMGELVFRAYLVGSDAVRDAGMLGSFPKWFAPSYDSPAITERNLFHPDWFEPILIAFFIACVGLVSKYTLGYLLFRVTSDFERLPFPMAPVAAQGSMALAQESETASAPLGPMESKTPEKKDNRWRIFSLGAYMGLGFGFIQIGIPAVTGIFLAQPVYLIPQPFVDLTTTTQSFLPATPTGISLDLGIVLLGFVLPYWAVMGTFIAIVLTVVINYFLHHYGILQTWQPGMDTVNTTFANNRDFWLSFGIGSGLGIAVVSIYSLLRDISKKMVEIKKDRAAGGDNGGAPGLGHRLIGPDRQPAVAHHHHGHRRAHVLPLVPVAGSEGPGHRDTATRWPSITAACARRGATQSPTRYTGKAAPWRSRQSSSSGSWCTEQTTQSQERS